MTVEDIRTVARNALPFSSAAEVGQMWERVALDWATEKSDSGHICLVREKVAELVGHLPPDSVFLELASGANNKAYYPKGFDFARVIATDISKEMLTFLGQTNPDIKKKIIADARVTLPFLSDSVDAALCFFGMRYFENQEEVLRQLIRVTKPGGYIGVADYDYYVYDGAVCTFDPCRLQVAILADGHLVTVQQLSQPLFKGTPTLYFLTIVVKK